MEAQARSAQKRADLAVPLSSVQIQIASKLHSRLKQWMATDAALAALGKRFPGFGLEAVMLKVSAINQLYGTNLYAVVRMAEHIVGVMTETDHASAGQELVERLAVLPKGPEQKTQWRHFSFASKFAHFFLDPERFPIYDSYAVWMVEYHLGLTHTTQEQPHPYLTYVTHLTILKQRAGFSCTSRELDRYLWLAGLYLAWRKNAKAQINAEVAQLFVRPSDEVTAELGQLLSTASVRADVGGS